MKQNNIIIEKRGDAPVNTSRKAKNKKIISLSSQKEIETQKEGIFIILTKITMLIIKQLRK